MELDPSFISKLQDYYAKHQVIPSYSAMGKLLGIAAKSWVAHCVGRMKEAGYLKVAPDRRLSPGPRFFERRLAYAPVQGDILWEASANPPSGKTELARLNDIDGPVVVDGKDLFVAGFQGRIAMLALDSGQVWWSRDFSASGGPALGADNVYATNAAGTVVALRRKDGAPVWEQSALAYRQVTAPAVSGDTVVVADFEGAVHWLDAGTGALVGRASVGDRVRFAPVVTGKLVVLQDDKGTVTAFRTRPAR